MLFDNTFDELLRGFFVRPMNFESARRAGASFRIDVSENEAAYTVHAEIPGVKKEDIHVAIDGDQVEISAEIRNEKEVKEGETRAARRAPLRQGLPRLRAGAGDRRGGGRRPLCRRRAGTDVAEESGGQRPSASRSSKPQPAVSAVFSGGAAGRRAAAFFLLG